MGDGYALCVLPLWGWPENFPGWAKVVPGACGVIPARLIGAYGGASPLVVGAIARGGVWLGGSAIVLWLKRRRSPDELPTR